MTEEDTTMHSAFVKLGPSVYDEKGPSRLSLQVTTLVFAAFFDHIDRAVER